MRNLLAKFCREEDGAAMIEYSVLIGIITVGAIAMIALVGAWVTDAWTDLEAALTP